MAVTARWPATSSFQTQLRPTDDHTPLPLLWHRYGALAGNIFFRDIIKIRMTSSPEYLIKNPTVFDAATKLGCTGAQVQPPTVTASCNS